MITTLHTEELCLEFLAELRWKGHPTCSKHICQNSENNTYIPSRKVYQCSRCNTQFSAKQGTIFHSSTVPLIKWFHALTLFAADTKSISSRGLADKIKVTQKTAWRMLQKFRTIIAEDSKGKILSGIVEVDEVALGAKKNRNLRLSQKIDNTKELRIEMDAEGELEKANRIKTEEKSKKKPKQREDKLAIALQHCTSEEQKNLLLDRRTRIIMFQKVHYKKYILGLKEKNGDVILIPIGRHSSEVNAETLIPILQKYISPDSHIMTDENPSYNELKKLFRKHSKVNHKKKEFVKKKKGTTTNRIENTWRQLRFLVNSTYIHFSWKYTDRYMNEFSFRSNLKGKGRGERCEILLSKTLQRVDEDKLTNFKVHYVHIPK